jgi:dihydrofolate reductase
MIIMIAAAAENNALGKDNKMLWHLPDDFKRFRQLTTGHYIIMGRKTFESLPKLLPGRIHVVISRQKDFQPQDCIVVENMEAALAVIPLNEDGYVIGGGEIYRLALPFTEKIELTRVLHNFKADTFFPEIDVLEWQLIETEYHSKDEKHAYDFIFETWLRRYNVSE